jgi:hypothetical protein
MCPDDSGLPSHGTPTAPDAPDDVAPAAPAGDDHLRGLLREAVGEALREQRGLIQTIVEDALEEMAFAEAVREAEAHERRFGRRAGFRAVEGEA